MSSATTAALCEFEAPPFTVVESKGRRSVFYKPSKFGFLDIMSRLTERAGGLRMPPH